MPLKTFRLRALLATLILGSTSLPAIARPSSFVPQDGPAFEEVATLMGNNKFQAAIEVMRAHIRSLGPNLPRQSMLCNLVVAAYQFGELDNCVTTLVTLADAAKDKVPADEIANALSTAALGYGELGDLSKGIELARRAIALSRGQQRLAIQLTLANLLGSAGDEAALRALLAEVSAIRPEAMAKEAEAAFRATLEGVDAKGVASGAHDKAIAQAGERELQGVPLLQHSVKSSVANGLKDYPLLLRLAEEGDVLVRRSLAREGMKQDPLSEAWGAFGRAWILLKLGRSAEAKTWLDKAAAQPQVTAHWAYSAIAGELAIRAGRTEDAISRFREAIEKIEEQRRSARGEEARINVLHDKQEVYSSLVTALVASHRIAEAFEAAERGKSRALVELLASRQGFGSGRPKSGQAGRSDTKELLGRLSAAEAALRQGAAASPASAESLRRTLQVVRKEISERIPATAALVTVQPVPLKSLQGALQNDEVLVEYFGHADKLLAFVVTGSSVRALILDGEILKSVPAFRAAVQNPLSQDVAAQGARLYDKLIAPLALPAGANVTLVPHADLHYLPFAALAAKGKWLGDSHSLRVLPSAGVLLELAKRPKPADARMLILGNPDVGDPTLDLPGAEREARAVARLRPESKVLLRRAASRAAIQEIGDQYGIVHLASHGTFDAQKPRSSGLILATHAGEDRLAGMLTVDDLYELSLDADLVTLSACETALGSVRTGDDVIGLTRGLFFAGARSIISSLWQVDDAATAELMVEFYKLLPTNRKAEALRKAQRAVQAKRPHPFYWAAFQLNGLD